MENTSLWRTIQIVTILSVLAVLLISLAQFPPPWQNFLRTTASCAIFCTLSLWHVYRHRNHAKRRTLLAFSLFAATAAITSFTRPLPSQTAPGGITSLWPVGLSVLALATSWVVLIATYRAFPTSMQWIGFTPRGWVLNLFIGALVGATLGFHLLLSAESLAGTPGIGAPTWPVLLWTFCSYAGIQAIGAELLFRGLSLPVLTEGLDHPFWQAAWRITFLNLLICLAWVPYSQYNKVWFYIVAYRMALSLANAFLRHRQKSMLPGLGANVIFNLFAAVIIT